MFALTLPRRRSAMQPDASPAANDAAAGADDGSRGRRAAKFQYATGDRPLDGYTIKRGVGRGGFGEVYFATSEAGKEVALKLIRRNLDVEVRGVRQCLNLKHPNLVALYDLRTDAADDQWVVMEYVAGESLDEAIARHPDGMPLDEALGWLRGIAAGVGYLHQSGIVHRDLKPANIYLERGAGPIESRVKIGDYGLSKFIATSRRSGQTESVGTVHYMAPEIAGGRYGREIDAYALGVILYEMLTGRVPFEGESVGEVLMKHLTAEPDLARLAEPFRSIVARTLAKDPELRLGSVEEMVAMLPGPVGPAVAPPFAATPFTPAQPAAWQPVSRPPHTDFPQPPREPLWQAMVDQLVSLRSWWEALAIPPLGKAVILFSAVTLLVVSGVAIAVPAAVLPFYLAYYVVWSTFLKEHPPEGARAETAAYQRPVKPSAPKRARYNWRLAAMQERSARTTREKLTTLTGSMLGAACAAVPLSLLAAPFLAKGTAADATATGLWLAVVTTLGAWGALVAGAVGDRFRDDSPPRRTMGLGLGLGLGAVATGLAALLGDGLPWLSDWSPDRNDVIVKNVFDFDPYEGVAFDDHRIAPPLAASLIYFGLVFCLVRWWRSSDYLRRSRVGFWSVAGTCLAAWLATFVCWYPQPLGIAMAGLVAVATQVASPWCPPSRRAALARGESRLEA